jgi:hypothetical protein
MVSKRPTKAANPVNIVALPNHTASEVNQQQLVPSTKAIILPKNDFLKFNFIIMVF